jgi:hypothetical protein
MEEEKRQNLRFEKPYNATFFLKENPHQQSDISGLRNIGKGGLKFLAYQKFNVGNILIFQIKFPFIFPRRTMVEGEVIAVHSVGDSPVFRTNIKFINLTPQAVADLEQMEQINSKKR